MSNANRIFLIGPSGSGKTFVGEALAKRMGVEFFDSDAIIEKKVEMPITRIFEDFGEEYFRDIERSALEGIISDSEAGVIATGGGAPTIDGMMETLSTHGIVVYLFAPLDELWNRLTVDPKELQMRPLLRKSGRRGLQDLILRREMIYRQAHYTIATVGLEVPAILDEILQRVDSDVSTP